MRVNERTRYETFRIRVPSVCQPTCHRRRPVVRSPRLPVPATALFAAALIASASVTDRAQQASPTFRTGVEAVAVDAFVTDRQGNPVGNLTVADFDILEDGKPQSITSFTEVNI